MNRSVLDTIRDDGFSLPRMADAYPRLSALKQVPQNPAFHGEGDAYRHTELVCEALTASPDWNGLPTDRQTLLFLAAAFHDIGKTVCTREENGTRISPKHTIVGEKIFRRMAYREAERFGLSFRQREVVAKLIRFHGLPVWFWNKHRPAFDLCRAAESIPLHLLYPLSRADVTGRIADTADSLCEQVELFRDYVNELGIRETPYPFANPYTRFQYFHKDDLPQDAVLYDGTTFDVILLSGLPLSGKDTWFAENGGGLPVISLDHIRETMGIAPGKHSGRVAQTALEQARVFLRREQPFIWNATNIVCETRQKLVRLFAGYGARVRILYLEAPLQELLRRNRKRERHIPETVLEDMIRKLEVPAPWEAWEVRLLPQCDSPAI